MTVIAASAGRVSLVALVVIGVIGLVALATWLLNRRRRDVWRELARRRGLTFIEPPEGPGVKGRIDGRAVDVTTAESSSDQGLAGVAVVRMSVGLHGVPRGMAAEGVPGLIGDLAALAEDRIEFDEEDFNRDALVTGDDEAAARAYWSRDRQQAFLQLVARSHSDQVAIRNAAVVAELREVVSDRRQLEQLLQLLLAAAPQLDGDGGNR